jgi:hypothetical protein
MKRLIAPLAVWLLRCRWRRAPISPPDVAKSVAPWAM